jgi:hypothetical protein
MPNPWLNEHKSTAAMNYFLILVWLRVRAVVFNATFNNISVISWRLVLLVGETGVTGENHRHAASRWQVLSHNFYQLVHLAISGIRTHNISGDMHRLHG